MAAPAGSTSTVSTTSTNAKPEGSYPFALAVTKSDSVNFGTPCSAIYVGGAGVVAAVMAGDGAVVEFTVPAGGMLKINAIRVNDTKTTATLMVALCNAP